MATKKKQATTTIPEEIPEMEDLFSNSSQVPTATEKAAAAEQAFAKADAAARRAVAKAEAKRMAAEQAKMEAEAAKTIALGTAKKKTEERVEKDMTSKKNWLSTHKVEILVVALIVAIIGFVCMATAYVGASTEKNRLLSSGTVATSDEGVNALIEEVSSLRKESEARDKKQSEKIDSLTKRVAILEKENKELRKELAELLKRVETLEEYHNDTINNTATDEDNTSNGGSGNGMIGSDSVPVNTDISKAVEQLAEQTEKDDKAADEETKRREEQKPQIEMISEDDVINQNPEQPTKAEEDESGNITISGGESITDTPVSVPVNTPGSNSSSEEEKNSIDWGDVPTVAVDDNGGIFIVEEQPVQMSMEAPVEELAVEFASEQVAEETTEKSVEVISEEISAEEISSEEAAAQEIARRENQELVLTIEVPVEENAADAA